MNKIRSHSYFKFIFMAALGVAIILGTLSAQADIIPRAEHPTPQVQRIEWLNLNGVWEFAETDDNEDESFLTAESYPETIVVPFCRESKLSGIERKGFVKNVWYRRNFTIPESWSAPRIRLHVGACDWLTRIWINGKYIGNHRGGNAAFAFDITQALQSGENTVVIHAFDDTRSRLQPLGKQSLQEKSQGIFYTRTTGIWQTVWLEGAGSTFISDYCVTPDPDNGRIILQVELDGPSQGLTVSARAYADDSQTAWAKTPAAWRNNHLVLNLTEKRLWSLDDPFLYDLKLTLARENEVIDEVQGYFGLRTIAIEGAAILINGQPVFQRLVLDQGFYPDGVWTAPSDTALKKDIELSKAVGFNGARLHQKVFEPRFLYWADKLGYLLWGEYPSFGADYANPAVDVPYIQEWVELVHRDRNHPSIIGWCPFNETPKEAGNIQNAVVYLTRALDPTRPVLDTSGWSHSVPDPELLDTHDYDQNPVTLHERWRSRFEAASIPSRYGGSIQGIPFFISEYGGIGWFEKEEGNAWGYGNEPESKLEFYKRFAGLADAQMVNRNFFGFCYTQLTDVEQEKNGVYYFDRSPKFEAKKLHSFLSREAAYEKNPPLETQKSEPEWHVLIGAFPDDALAKPWRYTTQKPSQDWNKTEFNDSTWKTGLAGFGQKGGWQESIRTPWTGKDIWLRQEFEYDGSNYDRAALVIHYDNATEVYVNGKTIWSRDRWNDRYEGFDVTEALGSALREGTNQIAIHCHQDEGGQYIDAALLIGKKEK